jgi:hypothetical protein
MSHRLMASVALFVLAAQAGWCSSAGAGTGPGANGDDGGNTVSVGVSTSSSSPGGSGSGLGGSYGSGPSCTYSPLPAGDAWTFGPGTPGRWVVVSCPGQQADLPEGALEWVPTVSTPPPSAAAGPSAAAARAAASIVLPALPIQLDPVSFSVVQFPTWLWVDPDLWHPYEATATAGGVTATATATPETVRWTMGDGGVVECDGPGTPYRIDVSASLQSTSCSYVYTRPSDEGPGVDGEGNEGAFVVSATVTWRVTWVAVGASGGGTLPSLRTTSTTPVRVEQVESVGVGQ